MGGNEQFDWVEDGNGHMFTILGAKRKARTAKKMEYVGWGSRQLMEFLESIDVVTEKEISQYDVASIITNYINGNNLMHPVKKKRVVCDELLFSLFGRKTISRNKIYDLLEPHFAENQVDFDDFFFGLDEEDKGKGSVQQKSLSLVTKPASKKRIVRAPKSCFAAIVHDNIKLVYLKKSLVEKLVKDPETFEGKIVGSFVRIKSDPNDYLQKNPYMVVQVTGLKKAPGADDKNAEVLLQVSNFVKDVLISMLSDDNFSEEECEDLRQRVKDGLLKRPTILELQEKVQALHEDVTNHWLVGELALLQKLINRANEKGWRRELYEYLERKKVLETDEEKARLLREIPEVVADDVEVDGTPDDTIKEHNDSPKSTLGGATENHIFDITPNGTSTAWISFSADSAGSQAAKVISKSSDGAEYHHADLFEQQKQPDSYQLNDHKEQKRPDSYQLNDHQEEKQPDSCQLNDHREEKQPDSCQFNDHREKKQPDSYQLNDHQERKQSGDYLNSDLHGLKNQVTDNQTDDHPEEQKQPMPTDAPLEKNVEAKPAKVEEKNHSNGVISVEVIDLSDDEDDVNPNGGMHTLVSGLETCTWLYTDPQGDTQGPFPVTSLKRWMELDYFPSDFKVWRTGQSQKDAVFLKDVISKIISS